MNHYKLIKSLITEIRKLRQEKEFLNEQYDSLCYSNYRLEQQRLQEQYEQEDKDYQRRELIKKLERAESWGDEWGVERLKRELKNL